MTKLTDFLQIKFNYIHINQCRINTHTIRINNLDFLLEKIKDTDIIESVCPIDIIKKLYALHSNITFSIMKKSDGEGGYYSETETYIILPTPMSIAEVMALDIEVTKDINKKVNNLITKNTIIVPSGLHTFSNKQIHPAYECEDYDFTFPLYEYMK